MSKKIQFEQRVRFCHQKQTKWLRTPKSNLVYTQVLATTHTALNMKTLAVQIVGLK